MNAETGVPVGDTTLLDKLRQSLEYEDPWTPRDVLGLARVNDVDFVCEAMNALPAVVTLIEAAQRIVSEEEMTGGVTDPYVSALSAALAAVGEATQ